MTSLFRKFREFPGATSAGVSKFNLHHPAVTVAFGIAVVLIAAASAYDAYLVYEYREGIVEKNPICNWLIQQEPDSVSLFLLAKGAGTLGVVTVLTGLFVFWRRAGVMATVSLVAFQVGLMTYLHTSEPDRRPIHSPFANLDPFAMDMHEIRENPKPIPVKSQAAEGLESKQMHRGRRRAQRMRRMRAKHRGASNSRPWMPPVR